MDGGQSQSDQERHQSGGHVHVAVVSHRQDDDEKAAGAHALVQDQDAHAGIVGVRVGREDAGRCEVLAANWKRISIKLRLQYSIVCTTVHVKY